MLIPTLLSPEHDALRAGVREFVGKHVSWRDVRAQFESATGYDEALWKRLAGQLGLPGVAVPEEYGGSGGGLLETFIVFAELGRALVPSPLFASAGLAVPLLLETGTESARRQYLPGISDGTVLATVACCEQSGAWDLQQVTTTARADRDGHRLDGTKAFVIDAAIADVIFTPARLDGRLAVFAVERGAPGLHIEALHTLDLSRRQGNVRLDSAPAQLISDGGDVADRVHRAYAAGIVALVAEQCGAAEHLLRLTVDYAKTRTQFGRPIGGFQAVKHKLADVAFDVERMWSAGLAAVTALAAQDPGSAVDVSLAKSFCSEAFFRVAAETIQLHGGIGFTWEHEAHLYFRRAKSSEVVLGSPAEHRGRLLKLLEDANPAVRN